jgi:hypothetical protein
MSLKGGFNSILGCIVRSVGKRRWRGGKALLASCWEDNLDSNSAIFGKTFSPGVESGKIIIHWKARHS